MVVWLRPCESRSSSALYSKVKPPSRKRRGFSFGLGLGFLIPHYNNMTYRQNLLKRISLANLEEKSVKQGFALPKTQAVLAIEMQFLRRSPHSSAPYSKKSPFRFSRRVFSLSIIFISFLKFIFRKFNYCLLKFMVLTIIFSKIVE